MRYLIIFFVSTVMYTACKQKLLSGAELENKLIKTMQNYLDKTAKPGAKYIVKDVNYYGDKHRKLYNCEFHVEMHVDKPKIDTIGVMMANIPNDFSKVERIQ